MKTRRTLVAGASLAVLAGAGLYAWTPRGGATASDPDLPFAETSYVLGDDLEAYDDFTMSGGPPPDGIPSIDDPEFVDADEADLAPGDMVIGFRHGGEVRAYPQRIVVYHEIVNDRVGGLSVSVTYCPLTATAQVFERGTTTLGTSGQLLNSNLVMYDRETESYCSQIAATCYRGEHRGKTLVEREAVWTTWERWRSVHPDTRVLTENTGHLRNYDRDPYGEYNPVGGYYAQQGTYFPVLHESDAFHAKEMVVGARTADRSGYFVLSELERDRVQATDSFLAVYDPDLDTGYIYATDGEEPAVTPAGDGTYELGGDTHAAADLPLDRQVSVEAFFFAWNAFYPASESPS